MASERDTYKTISAIPEPQLFKDRGSKFFGYAFPVTSEEEISTHLFDLKKEHHTARHWCYAWQLGMRYEAYRANDDGEPNNSAGMPIYGQLQAFDLTNVLVVVVRYFGGTKLGVGGLIQAYKTAAQMVLENANVIEKTIDERMRLTFGYAEMNTVMRLIKTHGIHIESQQMELACEMVIAVRMMEADRIFQLFTDTYKVTVTKL
ncbi:MAG: YigZ family protein [Bacteroidota bacterium]